MGKEHTLRSMDGGRKSGEGPSRLCRGPGAWPLGRAQTSATEEVDVSYMVDISFLGFCAHLGLRSLAAPALGQLGLTFQDIFCCPSQGLKRAGIVFQRKFEFSFKVEFILSLPLVTR